MAALIASGNLAQTPTMAANAGSISSISPAPGPARFSKDGDFPRVSPLFRVPLGSLFLGHTTRQLPPTRDNSLGFLPLCRFL
jgi:hypothetical protein